jgi:hypothetical protein
MDATAKGQSQCGTESGYYRHRRLARETPCAACKAAHTAAARRRLNRRQLTHIHNYDEEPA